MNTRIHNKIIAITILFFVYFVQVNAWYSPSPGEITPNIRILNASNSQVKFIINYGLASQWEFALNVQQDIFLYLGPFNKNAEGLELLTIDVIRGIDNQPDNDFKLTCLLDEAMYPHTSRVPQTIKRLCFSRSIGWELPVFCEVWEGPLEGLNDAHTRTYDRGPLGGGRWTYLQSNLSLKTLSIPYKGREWGGIAKIDSYGHPIYTIKSKVERFDHKNKSGKIVDQQDPFMQVYSFTLIFTGK